MGNAGIYVAERGLSAGILTVFRQQLQQPVGIGGAATDEEGGFFLDQRPFQMETAGKQADTHRSGNLVGIAFPAADIQHRRNAAAHGSGNAAFVQFHLAHNIRVEGREDTEKVRGIIDSSVVEQNQVLVYGTAAHIETAGSLTHGFNAGQTENGLDDVTFAEGGGNLVDNFYPDALDANLCITVVRQGVGRYHSPGEGQDLFFHHHIQHAIVPNLQVKMRIIQRVTAQAQQIVPHRKGNPVKTGGVGDGICAAFLVIDRNAYEGFSGRNVADMPAYVGFPRFSGITLPNLVHLVLESDHRALFGQETLKLTVVGRGISAIEITRGQRSEDGLAVKNKTGRSIAAHHISLLPKGIEGGFQKSVAGCTYGKSGLFGRILYIVDIFLELTAEQAYQRIQFYTPDFQDLLCEQGACTQNQGGKYGAKETFHWAAAFKTALQ